MTIESIPGMADRFPAWRDIQDGAKGCYVDRALICVYCGQTDTPGLCPVQGAAARRLAREVSGR